LACVDSDFAGDLDKRSLTIMFSILVLMQSVGELLYRLQLHCLLQKIEYKTEYLTVTEVVKKQSG